MGLALDTETELFLSLLLDFNDEKACEHSKHTDSDATRHRGPAVWYATFSCFDCGAGVAMLALCDGWKNYVESGGLLHCDCGHMAEGPEFYRYGWTKIDT